MIIDFKEAVLWLKENFLLPSQKFKIDANIIENFALSEFTPDEMRAFAKAIQTNETKLFSALGKLEEPCDVTASSLINAFIRSGHRDPKAIANYAELFQNNAINTFPESINITDYHTLLECLIVNQYSSKEMKGFMQCIFKHKERIA